MAAPAASASRRRRFHGDYETILMLGQGGMGVIHLARAVGAGGFERLVVVKRMHEHLASDPSASRRFLDEARVAAQVHHANVVGIHQAGSDGEGLFLVLDYVEGDSLDGLVDRSILKRNKVPPPIALRVILDALAGLHAVHETVDSSGRPLGILHRDVSLQNILVGRDGVSRLTDFGIAKSELAQVSTDARYLVGKLLYSPPEYLAKRQADRRTDIYALGLCFWMTLAGRDPWPDHDEAQLVHAILERGVPPLAEAGVQIAPRIQEILDRCCSGEPERRYPTAQAVLDDLEDVARSTGWLATHTEVAAWVEALIGRDLEQRRQRLALLLSKESEEDDRPAAPEPQRPASQGRTSRARNWAIGVAAVGLGALLTFALTRGRSAVPIASAPASAPVLSEPVLAASSIQEVPRPAASEVAVEPAASSPPQPRIVRPYRPVATTTSAPPATAAGITTTNPYR